MPPLKLLGPDWDSQVWQVFRLKNLKAIILTALDPRSKIQDFQKTWPQWFATFRRVCSSALLGFWERGHAQVGARGKKVDLEHSCVTSLIKVGCYRLERSCALRLFSTPSMLRFFQRWRCGMVHPTQRPALRDPQDPRHRLLHCRTPKRKGHGQEFQTQPSVPSHEWPTLMRKRQLAPMMESTSRPKPFFERGPAGTPNQGAALRPVLWLRRAARKPPCSVQLEVAQKKILELQSALESNRWGDRLRKSDQIGCAEPRSDAAKKCGLLFWSEFCTLVPDMWHVKLVWGVKIIHVYWTCCKCMALCLSLRQY